MRARFGIKVPFLKYIDTPFIKWLLAGDDAVVYQTNRDLLKAGPGALGRLQKNIAVSGWGERFLKERDPKTGMWGNGLYSPKWISTTYTLLDIKNLAIDRRQKEYVESAAVLISRLWKTSGEAERPLDLCVCGMLLNICCYAGIEAPEIYKMIDLLLQERFPEGGWNCRWPFPANRHGSLHTTANVLDGLAEYLANGYSYRKREVESSRKDAHEFILAHKLFRSDRTDKIIDDKMLMLSYPSRWKHDVLRCMDYFQAVGHKYDPRMEDALTVIRGKRLRSGLWPVQQKYSGRTHFEMEKTGKASRWNTLRALRVLKKYREEEYPKAAGFSAI